MKNSIIISIAVLMLCGLNACKKEDTNVSKKSKLEMYINGQPYKYDYARVNYPDVDSISYFFGFGFDLGSLQYPRQSFSIGVINKQMGKQRIYDIPSIGFPTRDDVKTYSRFSLRSTGEVECGLYNVLNDDSTNNWIEITRQKNNYDEVWGTFSLTMVKEYGSCPDINYGDTLYIRNATFYIKRP